MQTTAEVEFPDLHPDQELAYELPGRFKAIRCGRRWGKTLLAETIACDAAISGEMVGWFAPEYKFLAESYNDIVRILGPVKESSSKVEGVIRVTGGGRIDFWSLDNERAGRGRKYHIAIIDEAAFTKPIMMDVWNKSIKPTLLDYRGSAIVLSNTNGADADNFMWRICNEAEHGFVQYHAPTHRNPHLPVEELELLEKQNHPLVYRQEYLAEFVDFSADAFFDIQFLVGDDGLGVEYPAICDHVFAVMDCAVKDGKEHDGTAVSYWAYSRGEYGWYPLVCLDWDIISIEGALLETWIPNVFARLEELAKVCRARYGAAGVHIEDAQSGTILLQQCARRGLNAIPIASELTAAGKDARAISVSGYVYQRKVKISRYAYDKDVTFKGRTRNHFLTQVTGFRVGDKLAATRADDLLDTFCYSISLALGDSSGF